MPYKLPGRRVHQRLFSGSLHIANGVIGGKAYGIVTESQSASESNSFGDIRDSFLLDLRRVEATLDASATRVHGFMRNFATLRGSNIDKISGLLREIIHSARAVVSKDVLQAGEPHIPRLIHRIWLTSVDAPHEPPLKYIDDMIKEAEEYRPRKWQHRLWIQDPNLLPKTMTKLGQYGDLIKTERIDAALNAGEWRTPFDRLVVDRKYPFAADILRMKILYEHGGIYADMGARFKQRSAPEFIVDNFDYALIFWETMFFQNSLMAMPKKSSVGETFLRLVDHPDSIPFRLLGELTGITEGMAFSGLMVTAILLNNYAETMRVCPLAPNANLVHWAAEQSWYTKVNEDTGRHGNAYVPATGPSFLSLEKMRMSEPDALFRLPKPVAPQVL